MKIPNKIKLGGHIINVELVDMAHINGPGDYDNYHNLIRIEDELNAREDNVSECLLHEILEAIKAKNNLNIDHTELTVVSEVLFQVLRDNDLNFYNKGE